MEIYELQKRSVALRKKYVELEKKLYGKSWEEEEIMLGFVRDVGELSRLVVAKSGKRKVEDLDTKLSEELTDCLWNILVLYDLYGIDVETSMLNNLDKYEKVVDKAITEN